MNYKYLIVFLIVVFILALYRRNSKENFESAFCRQNPGACSAKITCENIEINETSKKLSEPAIFVKTVNLTGKPTTLLEWQTIFSENRTGNGIEVEIYKVLNSGGAYGNLIGNKVVSNINYNWGSNKVLNFIKQNTITLIGDSFKKIVKHRLLKTFRISKNYVLTFTIFPTGKKTGWTNILQSTISNKSCCGSKDRLPGVWFFSNTSRLHIRTSTKVGNDGVNIPMSLPLHQETNVKIKVLGNKLTVILTGAVNYKKTKNINKNRESGLTHLYV